MKFLLSEAGMCIVFGIIMLVIILGYIGILENITT